MTDNPAMTADASPEPLDLDRVEKMLADCSRAGTVDDIVKLESEWCAGFGHRLIAALREARRELSMWNPMTPEEAEQAIADAACDPVSEEEIDRIIDPLNEIKKRIDATRAALQDRPESNADRMLREEVEQSCPEEIVIFATLKGNKNAKS